MTEYPYLISLPPYIPEVYRIHQRTVDMEGYITVHSNRYSAPCKFISKRLAVRETKDKIIMVQGHKEIAVHKKLPEGSRGRSTLPEHKIERRDPRRSVKEIAEEIKLKSISSEIASYITDLKKSKTGRYICAVKQLYRLYTDYRIEDFMKAVRRAHEYGVYDIKRVETIILKNMAEDWFDIKDTVNPDIEKLPGYETGKISPESNLEIYDEILITPKKRRMMLMKRDLKFYIEALLLKGISEIIDKELKYAQSRNISYSNFLTSLLRTEYNFQKERKIQNRIKNAKIPDHWVLDTYPFHIQKSVNRKLIYELAELDFIQRAENIVLIGQSGVGKTGLATGLLLKDLYSGHTGKFIKAEELFSSLYQILADKSSRTLLNRLSRLDVILIDEMGYLNLKKEETNIFFKLMDNRYNKKATIITTNLGYSEWGEFLGHKSMVAALLDRLLQNCHTIMIKGKSLRKPKYKPCSKNGKKEQPNKDKS